METNDSKNRRSKLLYAGVIVILCIFFVVGFIYGLNSVLKMEGNYPPADLSEGRTAVPQTNDEALGYLNNVLDAALAQKPRFSGGSSFSIDGDSLETTGPETLKNTLLYIRDGFTDQLNGSFTETGADFSEGFEDLLRLPQITADDITGFTCDYIYYKCASCGETSVDPLQECEACGSEHPYLMQYRDNYTITYDLNVTEDLLNKNCTIRTDAQIRALLGDQLDNVLKVNNIDVDYTKLTIRLVVRRATDEVQSLVYSKGMNVKADADFTEKYGSLGKLDFSVDVTENESYNFVWPQLSLNEHTLDMEPKGSDNLLATLTCDDPTQYDAVWSSSDESVVTVDEEGYLKAGKNPGTAVITATFEFKGKTYSDSCRINVKKDVESLSLNKRKVSLNAGQTYQLTAKVSPSDATIRTVTWYTTDESIATVDENGVVTAVSPGTVVIYALSDDLYFKSSCEVTVK